MTKVVIIEVLVGLCKVSVCFKSRCVLFFVMCVQCVCTYMVVVTQHLISEMVDLFKTNALSK